MTTLPRVVLLSVFVFAAFAACGDGGGSGDDDDDDGDGGATIDADPNAPDASDHPDGQLPPGCDTPGTTQCSDCVDNDEDGQIDGFDIECITAEDNDEGSFATGIPGDNSDPNWQDCFFDGDSGSGNDGCRYNTCCLFPPTSDEYCTSAGDLASCDVAAQTECIATCGPASPPGCDCFGCCTVCDAAGCETIITNPAIAPNCDASTIHDPVACPQCVLNTDCGTACDANPEDCILCPGEDPSNLPDSCTGQQCVDDQEICDSETPCPVGDFCSNGCCIPEVVVD